MADDAMLVNFSVDETFTRKLPKFKGGSWRDRLIAKKIAKNRGQRREQGEPGAQDLPQRQRVFPQYPAAQDDADFASPRPAKRRKEDGEFKTSGTNLREKLQDQHTSNRPRSQQATKPREVVSSLFTYNPTSTTATEPLVAATDEIPSKPSNAPLPDGIDTFTSLGLSPTLAAHLLTKMELKNPTAIQKASIVQLLKEDSDAFIQSETGSGKTLAYLLPLVQRIMSISNPNELSSARASSGEALHRDSGLFGIVLAPTRELCKQISVVLERVLGCAHYIVAGTVIGGEKKKSEKARLRKGINILVATPGRLVDHLENTKVLDVSNVRWLVLDEGDRLVDLGFEEDISKIVNTLDTKQRKNSRPGLPERRTTVLCSATMKMNVQRLGEISLKDAVLVKGAGEDDDVDETSREKSNSQFLAPAQLKQSYMVVAAKLRLVTLTALLRRTFARKGSVMKAIVFVSCADSVEFHFKALTRTPDTPEADDASDSSTPPKENPTPTSTTTADAILPSSLLSSKNNPLTLYKLHGSLPQPTRTAIVKAFAAATTPSLLIATDVASRGLDLPNLDLVIEYDPPFSSDDHLHRIGRTARLGRDGRATIFLLPGKEEGYFEVLKRSYKSVTAEGARPAVTHTSADDTLKRGFAPTSGLVGSGSDWEQRATDFQLEVERWVLSDAKHGELARRAFQSHVRAYATHVAAERGWFDIKELHLGHLAKAFGLRDAPGRMNIQGMGKRGASTTHERRRKAGDDEEIEEKVVRPGEIDEAARKMRRKVGMRGKMMGAGADEFNIA